MEKFAFMIHPLDARRDASRKWPWVKYLPTSVIEWGLKHKHPILVSHITGVRSSTGAEAEGWFIGCTLTPGQFLGERALPIDFIYERLTECGRIAEDLGARILGLGAFTSVVGDGGVTVSNRLNIPVTTGNSYTVAVAIEETLCMAERMEIGLPAEIAVVGATGSIGSAAAEILSAHASRLVLVGRSAANLGALADRLRTGCAGSVDVSTDVSSGIRNADLILTVTSAVDSVINPEDIKPGAVVCDVARPRDVSRKVVEQRDDVLVIEGGMVKPPGDVDFGFNFGYPPGLCLACMAETMMLTLDGRYESFTLGKSVTGEQVRTTQEMARKHGFQIANPRSFEEPVTDDQIDAIRERARKNRRHWRPDPGRPGAAARPQAAPA